MRVIEDYSSFKSEEYPSFADRWEKLVELLGCSKAACKALMDPEISARMAVAPLFELSVSSLLLYPTYSHRCSNLTIV